MNGLLSRMPRIILYVFMIGFAIGNLIQWYNNGKEIERKDGTISELQEEKHSLANEVDSLQSDTTRLNKIIKTGIQDEQAKFVKLQRDIDSTIRANTPLGVDPSKAIYGLLSANNRLLRQSKIRSAH